MYALFSSASVATRAAGVGVAAKSGAEADTFPAMDNKLIAKKIVAMIATEYFMQVFSIGEESGRIPPQYSRSNSTNLVVHQHESA
jgi:hypothetical protein